MLKNIIFGAKCLLDHSLQKMDILANSCISKPSNVYLHITSGCNLKCFHCNLPKVDGIKHGSLRKVDELSTHEWKRVFTQLREWLGPFKLNISGGEPLIRKDIVELLKYSCELGIMTGIVTNGTLIDDKIAHELAVMNLFNINISLDGFREETHLHFRERYFDRTIEAFHLLQQAKIKNKSNMKIVLKYTLMGYNLDEAIDVVEWVQNNGFDGVMMQPLEINQDEEQLSYLWPRDTGKLDATVDKLMELKRNGYPILNDTSHLEKIKLYFRAAMHKQASLLERTGICRVGVTNFFIGPNGDVVTCFYMEPIGNLCEHSPREIWKSSLAQTRRKEIRICGRDCLLSCLTSRTLRDKAEIFWRLFFKC